MKKILSLLLVGIMVVSMVPTAFATTDYSNGTQVEYTATGSEAYTITVPAQLAPSGSGTVTLSGTWASDRKVTVTAGKTVTLVNSINAADTKTLDVTFAGISKAGDNTQAKTYTEAVSVAAMPADALFGTWSGTFYYNVEVGAAVEMISFTMEGEGTFQAEEGMTWGEWLESEYNTDGYYFNGEGCVTMNGNTGVWVSLNSKIIANNRYKGEDIF